MSIELTGVKVAFVEKPATLVLEYAEDDVLYLPLDELPPVLQESLRTTLIHAAVRRKAAPPQPAPVYLVPFGPAPSLPASSRSPYRCPCCNGQGTVSRPPYVAGDQTQWSSTNTGPYPCKACNGTGVLWSTCNG